MQRVDILDWIKTDYAPLTFSLPDETILQFIDNSIRYFNAHSGYKIVREVTVTGNKMVLDPEIKTVVQVWPSMQTTNLQYGDPSWSLLGIQSINNLTSDIIQLNEAYKLYRNYLGADFRFYWKRSDDPKVGGTLFLENLSSQASNIEIVGTKRIMEDEDVTQEYIVNWLLLASKAQVKMAEGNALRKGELIGLKTDGASYIDEGQKLWDEMKSDLEKNSRWVSLVARM